VKIKTLSLTDFRAFPGPAPATFKLDGKNLLVYGENGSGKSSLFKALSGFFAYGQPPPRLPSLKNSFSGQSLGYTSINVVLDNGLAAAWRMQLVTEVLPYRRMVFVGPSLQEDHPAHRRAESGMIEIEQAAKFSACLDYRTLLGTNYKHGDEAINLFEPMVRELLAGFVDLATNRSILELWLAVEHNLPQKNTTTNLFASVMACQEFNGAVRRALALLLPEASAILKRLCPDGLKLSALPFDGVRYNGAKAARDKAYVNKTVGLEIAFRGLQIERPQHYLNEARQSAIGLALYLGARLACAPRTTPHLKLLVLDDVLVGLDHSNRLPVLDVLADLFSDWQVVLMTHDRGWFDLAYAKILPAVWCCYEIFEGDQSSPAPSPVFRSVAMDPSTDRPARIYLDYAKHMLTLNYPEAAANYARQAMEATLRGGCEKLHIPIPFRRNPKKVEAHFLLEELERWTGNAKVTKAKLDPILAKVTLLKNVVMNPYSHPSAPNIPKSEVQQAINTVEELLTLIG
jgi:energy-coupling factor transporter ATP-binding protein EcfA2